MGSGRGKTRRTQTSGEASVRSVLAARQRMLQNSVDSVAWDNFVSSQGLETTSLAKYYLKAEPAGKQLSRAELEEILHELFQDFVAAGAVSLPPGASVGDFSFVIRDEEGPLKEGLYMADKRSGKEERI